MGRQPTEHPTTFGVSQKAGKVCDIPGPNGPAVHVFDVVV